MKYFENCKTIDELRAEYRRLAKIHHPDLGGDTATMQEINAQYEKLHNEFKDRDSHSDNENVRNRAASQGSAAEYIHIVDVLIHLDGIKVELCGCWLWISGDTFPVREQLKAAGCKWCSKKHVWAWCPAEFETTHKRNKNSMDDIRRKYGSEVLADNRKNPRNVLNDGNRSRRSTRRSVAVCR